MRGFQVVVTATGRNVLNRALFKARKTVSKAVGFSETQGKIFMRYAIGFRRN
ncbi:MAG: hypothetical protein NWE76_10420 [Candidatus Bathyarchaeota archaeon]|nr:hypothetical protein [Candidatus Bathyarchaeota archaeon]